MTPEVEAALEGSIRKWEDIVNGTGVDEGFRNCPLCSLFYNNHCRGCPVYKFVQRPRCAGTPYNEFSYISSRRTRYAAPLSPEEPDYNRLLNAAKAELEFLKGLRT